MPSSRYRSAVLEAGAKEGRCLYLGEVGPYDLWAWWVREGFSASRRKPYKGLTFILDHEKNGGFGTYDPKSGRVTKERSPLTPEEQEHAEKLVQHFSGGFFDA